MHEHPGYFAIENYGMIGNQHTVALANIYGSIDFMCFPRFDSPTIFSALLDKDKGGNFDIMPQMEKFDCKQLYLPDTNVLLTRFLSEEGVLEITDFMPVKEKEHNCTLVRKVAVVRGEVHAKMNCSPRFNYARDAHSLSGNEYEMLFRDEGREQMPVRLLSTVPMYMENNDAFAGFKLQEKEAAYFVLEAVSEKGDKEDVKDGIEHYAEDTLNETVNYWKEWISHCDYSGRWREMVNRSALTLKALTSSRYGSMVAAPTFGLPESIGGPRNWDYRYTWIRDSAFTMYALIRLGFTEEAGNFMEWIQREFDEKIKDRPGALQLMYGVDGTTKLDEVHLDHLHGYKGSRPVRIGNDAYNQFQLDIYGELMDCIYLYNKYGNLISYHFWLKLEKQVDFVAENWFKEDYSIWEVRSGMQKFLFSRIMCWVALDRAIVLAEERSFPYPREKWRDARDAIFRDIYHNFWSEEKQAFVQYKGSDVLDAAALIIPLVRFLSPYEPRFISTLRAIENELVSDSLVYRYNTQEYSDGLHGSEGTFSMCSFWYVECLARIGEVEKARFFFEKMIGYANHLGLYAEQLGLHGEHLGNYPQAFTHLGLISAAYKLNDIIERN